MSKKKEQENNSVDKNDDEIDSLQVFDLTEQFVSKKIPLISTHVDEKDKNKLFIKLRKGKNINEKFGFETPFNSKSLMKNFLDWLDKLAVWKSN